jgi:hypothetical protein
MRKLIALLLVLGMAVFASQGVVYAKMGMQELIALR